MATKAAKKTKASGPRFVPHERWLWMDYFDPERPDDPPLRCEVRADLTFSESNSLSFDADDNPPMTDIWDMLAPFVRDWNLDDATGKPIPAPAEAGGGQFDYLPLAMFWRIWRDLKFRSSGDVDSKRSGASGSPLATALGVPTETPQ